ncbi:TolC family protein [Sediminicola sp. 1XM1-17]|uniref:TolC family protein n=1 Tax=Sediminicola sp. 1XM1-17 TaxID=3127702 RepID=UPI0030772DBC
MKFNKVHIISLFFSILCVHLSQGQTLESFLEQAENNNPELQAFVLRYNISKEKINEANTLGNTEVSAGLFVSEPETRTGAQKARFSVKQMVPWFGSITARENYISALSEVDYLDMVIIKRKLRLSVSQSYYRLYAIKKQQELLEENIVLLKTYEKLALTSVEVGNASAVDVLRLQIRQNELLAQKDVLVLDYVSEESLFNNLLNREEELQIDLADNLSVIEEHKDLTWDVQLHPELLKYDRLYESVTQSEILNRKETNPDLGFGLDYIPVAERNDMTFSDNGKDIIMPMVTVSIPIFNSKFKSRTVQNSLRQEEISAQKMNQKNKLKTLLSKAISSRESARIKYNIQEKNYRQAKDAEEILIKNYETGTINFNDVLEIQELQLKIQMNQIEAVKNYYMESALINYLGNNE